MRNFIYSTYISLIIISGSLFAEVGDVTVTLIGIDPLTINIKGDTKNEEAGTISIYLYYRDDGVTDLNINNVDVTQITDTFGWGTFLETKLINTGSYSKGGHTFTRRLTYDNVNLVGDDFWTTSGINAIVCDFTTVGTGNAYVEEIGTDGLADWSGSGHNITYANQDISLPVELSSFNAIVENNSLSIRWITESEINNLGFEIYRAPNEDGEYVLLSSYKSNSDLEGQGNSSVRHEYNFTDNSAKPQTTYWYKLADLDYEGVKTFHGPVSVTAPKALPTGFKLHSNYPNPFNPTTTIRFDVPPTSSEFVETRLIIFNTLGQVTKTLYQERLNAGSYEVQWDGTTDSGNNAPSGIYFVVYRANEFSQTKKLVLVK
jgi:hypothetical protein